MKHCQFNRHTIRSSLVSIKVHSLACEVMYNFCQLLYTTIPDLSLVTMNINAEGYHYLPGGGGGGVKMDELPNGVSWGSNEENL